MVVSITNISPTHGSRYYASEGNYLEKEQHDRSDWAGRLASAFDLRGQVEPETFVHLLQGRSPTGEVLVSKRLQPNARERAGIDLTTSVPKSVSVQALVFGDERLEEAHRQATDRMLAFLENRYAFTRQMWQGERTRVLTGELLIAQFQHTTSRELDPQLHTHNVILNLQRISDDQWRSLDNEAIYRAKMLLGLVYRNELAREVQKLGYKIQVTNPRQGLWELNSFSSRQLEQFSKRSQQIHQQAGEGATSQQKAWVAVSSRRKQKQVVPRQKLEAVWREEAISVDLSPVPPALSQDLPANVFLAQSLIDTAVERLSRQKTVFRREELERLALTQIGQVNFSELQTAIDQHPNLTASTDPKGRQFCTYHPGEPYESTDALWRNTQPDGESNRSNPVTGVCPDGSESTCSSDFRPLYQFREESQRLLATVPKLTPRGSGLAGMEPLDSSHRRPDGTAPTMAQTFTDSSDPVAAPAGDSTANHWAPQYDLQQPDRSVSGTIDRSIDDSQPESQPKANGPELEPDRR